MSNQTISQDKISQNKEAINKFYSVREDIYSAKLINNSLPSSSSEVILPNNLINKCANSKIKEYFVQKLSIRAQRRKDYAAYIKSTEDVFKVLEFGNTKNIIDAYDSAVDILAECNENTITEAFNTAIKKYICDRDDELFQFWEKNWEILIKGITYSLKIETHKKMSLILSLCNFRNKLSRLIKLTIIDSIIDLDIDTDLAEVMLQLFISERESDDFVRKHALQQASECL